MSWKQEIESSPDRIWNCYLVAGVDPGPLHEVPEDGEGEGGVDGLHPLKQLEGVQGGPRELQTALVTSKPETEINHQRIVSALQDYE